MSGKPHSGSRRSFLTRTGVALGGGMFAMNLPELFAVADEARSAFQRKDPFVTLTEEEAVEVEAFAAQILPSVDGLGATEAGSVYFIDRALGAERGDLVSVIREGLADLQSRAQAAHGASFSRLGTEDQIALMKEIETTEFFRNLRFLTLAGVLTHPSYGGNKDRIGWKLIGFDDRHFWQPPFGHYDANYQDPYRHDH